MQAESVLEAAIKMIQWRHHLKKFGDEGNLSWVTWSNDVINYNFFELEALQK